MTDATLQPAGPALVRSDGAGATRAPGQLRVVPGTVVGGGPVERGRGPERARDSAAISDEARSLSAVGQDGEPLSAEEQQELERLQERDAEVRTHEQAHVAAAGDLYRGGPYYEYEAGPDGKRYAVGGSVRIDTSEGDTPEETIRRAQTVRRSALAPQEPSSTDLRVAAEASRQEAEARAELAEERRGAERLGAERGEEASNDEPGGPSPVSAGVSRALSAYEGGASLTPSIDTFA